VSCVTSSRNCNSGTDQRERSHRHHCKCRCPAHGSKGKLEVFDAVLDLSRPACMAAFFRHALDTQRGARGCLGRCSGREFALKIIVQFISLCRGDIANLAQLAGRLWTSALTAARKPSHASVPTAYRARRIQVGQPGRDEDIDKFNTFLRDCGRLSIPTSHIDFHPGNTCTTKMIETREAMRLASSA